MDSDKKFPRPRGDGLLDESMRDTCIDLLTLEVSRAQQNVLSDPPVCEASERYKADIAQSARVLRIARRRSGVTCRTPDVAFLWLTLLGHRLAIEKGLFVDGLEALAVVASDRLGLPCGDIEAWSDETLFWQFTETALRDEWDYQGLQFRVSAGPTPFEPV